MGNNFTFILVAFFINIIICIAASFCRQYRKAKVNKTEVKAEAQEVACE